MLEVCTVQKGEQMTCEHRYETDYRGLTWCQRCGKIMVGQSSKNTRIPGENKVTAIPGQKKESDS